MFLKLLLFCFLVCDTNVYFHAMTKQRGIAMHSIFRSTEEAQIKIRLKSAQSALTVTILSTISHLRTPLGFFKFYSAARLLQKRTSVEYLAEVDIAVQYTWNNSVNTEVLKHNTIFLSLLTVVEMSVTVLVTLRLTFKNNGHCRVAYVDSARKIQTRILG